MDNTYIAPFYLSGTQSALHVLPLRETFSVAQQHFGTWPGGVGDRTTNLAIERRPSQPPESQPPTLKRWSTAFNRDKMVLTFPIETIIIRGSNNCSQDLGKGIFLFSKLSTAFCQGLIDIHISKPRCQSPMKTTVKCMLCYS